MGQKEHLDGDREGPAARLGGWGVGEDVGRWQNPEARLQMLRSLGQLSPRSCSPHHSPPAGLTRPRQRSPGLPQLQESPSKDFQLTNELG